MAYYINFQTKTEETFKLKPNRKKINKNKASTKKKKSFSLRVNCHGKQGSHNCKLSLGGLSIAGLVFVIFSRCATITHEKTKDIRVTLCVEKLVIS